VHGLMLTAPQNLGGLEAGQVAAGLLGEADLFDAILHEVLQESPARGPMPGAAGLQEKGAAGPGNQGSGLRGGHPRIGVTWCGARTMR